MHLKKAVRIFITIVFLLPLHASFAQQFVDLYTFDYDAIDNRVKGMSGIYSSVEKLAEELFAPYDTPHERVRAAWMWVTHNIEYDVDIYNRQGYDAPSNPKDVIQKGKAVCFGYSNLMKALLDWSDPGLCQIVLGDVRTGFNKTQGHAWNLLTVYGYSYLLDATWGAGYVEVEKLEKNAGYLYFFKKYYQEFWYFTPPSYFASSHFTVHEAAQLTTSPITKELFMELPWISPKYYAGYLRSLQQRYNDELMAKPRFYLTKIIPNSHGKAFRVLKPVGKDLGAYRYDYVFDQGWNIKVPKGEEINLHFYSELPIDQFKLKVPVDSLSSYEVVEVNSVEQKRGRGYDYIIQYKAEYDGILALYPGEEEMVRYKLTIEEKVKKK